MPDKVDSPDQKYLDLLENHFNNDWTVKSKKAPLPISAGIEFAKSLEFQNSSKLGTTGACNYSNSYASYVDMDNNFFGVYDETNHKSTYLRKAKDNQYSNHVRVGALLNLSYVIANGLKIEWHNLFNQIGKDRYTSRTGIDAQDNHFRSAEYYYDSRSVYNGQLGVKYAGVRSQLEGNFGFSSINKNMPDRRRYSINDQMETGKLGLYNSNDITREYTLLNEHTWSIKLNYKYQLHQDVDKKDFLRTGLYAEHRNRSYRTREFFYNWEGNNNLPQGFEYLDVTNELLQPQNYGSDKIYLLEKPKWSNNYDGKNLILASYIAANIDLGKLNLYGGVRYEYNAMTLVRNTRDEEKSPYELVKKYNNFFPSLNMMYSINEKSQLRGSWGCSVNRPEFREISPSVFYDFELGSDVMGNSELQPAKISNCDLRYEYYPSKAELISAAFFYKHFVNPIEWTYTMTGGTDAVYSFQNAKNANSFGVEVEMKKELGFIGLKDFSMAMNVALISSHVNFNKGSKEHDRPMQGQSPYLINAALFYHNADKGWDCSLLYNRIGKRIIGVGRLVGVVGDLAVNIPDAYEMPHNLIDISLSKKIEKKMTIRLGVKDLLAETVVYKQFNDLTLTSGEKKQISEVTRTFKPGRTILLNMSYRF